MYELINLKRTQLHDPFYTQSKREQVEMKCDSYKVDHRDGYLWSNSEFVSIILMGRAFKMTMLPNLCKFLI